MKTSPQVDKRRSSYGALIGQPVVFGLVSVPSTSAGYSCRMGPKYICKELVLFVILKGIFIIYTRENKTASESVKLGSHGVFPSFRKSKSKNFVTGRI